MARDQYIKRLDLSLKPLSQTSRRTKPLSREQRVQLLVIQALGDVRKRLCDKPTTLPRRRPKDRPGDTSP
ncbi:hypothetical protein [Tateyamaria sp. SN3-11]|uniref:hypothetical protein n=1 Tax=Tateyamaria sp. SN3-11 TaxID=3092147 RepID=UPI0039E8AA50